MRLLQILFLLLLLAGGISAALYFGGVLDEDQSAEDSSAARRIRDVPLGGQMEKPLCTQDVNKGLGCTCISDAQCFSGSCVNGTCAAVEPTEELIESRENDFICPTPVYDPQCGVDGRTYQNKCRINVANVQIACAGECPCEVNRMDSTVSEDDLDEPILEDRIDTICPTVFDPQCGINGVTYENECRANAANVQIACAGECPCEGSEQTQGLNCNSLDLNNNNEIELSELLRLLDVYEQSCSERDDTTTNNCGNIDQNNDNQIDLQDLLMTLEKFSTGSC